MKVLQGFFKSNAKKFFSQLNSGVKAFLEEKNFEGLKYYFLDKGKILEEVMQSIK